MAKEIVEFVLNQIFTKIAKMMADAIKDYPEKEDEIRGSIATAFIKTEEFGELLDIEYDGKKIVFKFDGVNLVADLQR